MIHFVYQVMAVHDGNKNLCLNYPLKVAPLQSQFCGQKSLRIIAI